MESFSSLLALCVENSPVTGEFPTQRPVTRIFDVFFELSLNKRLSKQSSGWWFETPSCSLWRHCNTICYRIAYSIICILSATNSAFWPMIDITLVFKYAYDSIWTWSIVTSSSHFSIDPEAGYISQMTLQIEFLFLVIPAAVRITLNWERCPAMSDKK